jgi:hypothetical protein
MWFTRGTKGIVISAIFAGGTALACNPVDPNCKSGSGDPCASFLSDAVAYNNCRFSMPRCPGMSGPVLVTCLTNQVHTSAGSTLTATVTATSTSTSTNVNRANNFAATKYEDDLFNDQANNSAQNSVLAPAGSTGTAALTGDSVGAGNILTQNDAYGAQNAVITGCAGTNLSGRTDSLCASTPNDPECTGLNSSLGNAATCAQPGPNDPATGKPTCLKYGSFGFSIDEWLVFGQQYYNSLTGCFNVVDASDSTGVNSDTNKLVTRSDRLQAMADFAALPPDSGAAVAAAGANKSTVTGASGASTVSSAGKPQKVPLWQSVSEKFDDGAAVLGYDRGDLVKRSASGQSFAEAFNESPFAATLPRDTRAVVEAALGDPGPTIEKTKEQKFAQAGNETSDISHDKNPQSTAVFTGSPVAGTAKPASPSNISGAVAVSEGALAANGATRTIASAANASTPPASGRIGRELTEREIAYARAGLSGSAAAAAVAGHRPTLERPQASPASLVEGTLFERVTLSYRRITPRMKPLDDSKTASDVRDTETPTFFKNL